MPISQEHIAALVAELGTLTHQAYRHDVLFSAFGSAFHHFGESFKKSISSWINLDDTTLERLKAGAADDLLDLEIISQLANLLLDEFGPTLTPEDCNHTQHLRDVCGQLRALLNTAMQRPPDERLPSRLDQPAVRRQLTFEFDRVLLGPVQQMIETTEHLLAATNLNELQRQDLDNALKNSRRLHRVLLTARPLIETQNFRAMALLSHEYRSPFCGITGFFHLVLKLNNEGLDEAQIDYLRALTGYSTTILGMVNDLNDAMRLLAGDDGNRLIEMTFSPPYKIAERVLVNRYVPPCIAVDMQISETLPYIKLCDSYLWQCLDILLNNAIKYTREGCISITADQHEGYVVFQVKDTGIGIPQDQQQAIFEPFVQVGEQTKGLGLGLYLARQFVQRAGGTLTVQSEIGVGSVFTLSVPVAHESEAEA